MWHRHAHICAHVHFTSDCRQCLVPAVAECGPTLRYLTRLCFGLILSLVLLTKRIWSWSRAHRNPSTLSEVTALEKAAARNDVKGVHQQFGSFCLFFFGSQMCGNPGFVPKTCIWGIDEVATLTSQDWHFYFLFNSWANWSVKTKKDLFHMMWLWLVIMSTYEATL